MGIEFNPDGKSNINVQNSNDNAKYYTDRLDVLQRVEYYFTNFNTVPDFAQHKYVTNESYNIKVALWQMPHEQPYSKICKRCDSDNNSWLEYRNKYNKNEIEEAEKSIGSKLNQYKIVTKSTNYDDGSADVVSKYPNGTKITERYGENSVFVNIKDKNNRTVAEKIYGYDSTEGRKVVYQNIEKDNNIFTVAQVYSYDTRYNRKTDVVNFGYTNSTSTLTDGCHLEKEYYLLNGEEVDAKRKKNGKYKVKDKNGKNLKFKAE